MIVGGTSHTGRDLGDYLTAGKNERAEVWAIRGSDFAELGEAVKDWRLDALGTKAEKPLYHAWLRPSDTDRALSREDWDKAIALFETEMGFEGQPRAVIHHHDDGQGEQGHIHLVYSRIKDGKAIPDSWNYVHHEKARAAIEKALDLDHVYAPHLDRDEQRRVQGFDAAAKEQAKRLKIDPRDVKADVSALYAHAKDGPAFAAVLAAHGYTLAQGDRRAYVILDEAGGVHNLARMSGAKAGDLRDRLKDHPLQNLPTVEAARAALHARDRTPDHEAPAATVRDVARELTAPPHSAPSLAPCHDPRPAAPDRVDDPAAAREAHRAATIERIRAAWRGAEGDGLTFLVALGGDGLRVAHNDWGGFVAVAENGSVHSMGASVHGVDAVGMARAVKGVEAEGLLIPSVAECRADIAEARAERQRERERRHAEQRQERAHTNSLDLTPTQAAIRQAYAATMGGESFAAALHESGLILARADATDAEAAAILAGLARHVKDAPEWKTRAAILEGDLAVIDERGHAHRLSERTTGATAPERAGKLAGLAAAPLPPLREAQAAQRTAQQERQQAHRTERERERDLTRQQHSNQRAALRYASPAPHPAWAAEPWRRTPPQPDNTPRPMHPDDHAQAERQRRDEEQRNRPTTAGAGKEITDRDRAASGQATQQERKERLLRQAAENARAREQMERGGGRERER